VLPTEIRPNPHYADIEQLNQWALERKFPLTKVSFPCYKKIQKEYALLPVGNALGWNVGPKLIAKVPYQLEEIPRLRMFLPGEMTMAHFLATHLLPPPREKVFCLYHEIEGLLQEEEGACGIIIHESRFTFQTKGLHEMVDLGALWHKKYGLPLPLGGLVLHRDYPLSLFTEILRASLESARKAPDNSLPFIQKHAQEKRRDVIEKHIALYVTEETYSLSSQGKEAIDLFLVIHK